MGSVPFVVTYVVLNLIPFIFSLNLLAGLKCPENSLNIVVRIHDLELYLVFIQVAARKLPVYSHTIIPFSVIAVTGQFRPVCIMDRLKVMEVQSGYPNVRRSGRRFALSITRFSQPSAYD